MKNIHAAYIIQTIETLGILGYDLATKGFNEMRENPLWLLFMITAVISAYLSMNISVDHESDEIQPVKNFSIIPIVYIYQLRAKRQDDDIGD